MATEVGARSPWGGGSRCPGCSSMRSHVPAREIWQECQNLAVSVVQPLKTPTGQPHGGTPGPLSPRHVGPAGAGPGGGRGVGGEAELAAGVTRRRGRRWAWPSGKWRGGRRAERRVGAAGAGSGAWLGGRGRGRALS